MSSTIQRQRDPSLLVAFQHAWSGIRMRPARQLATGAGVALGVAFYAYLQGVRVLGAADDQAKLRFLAAMSLMLCAVGIANTMLMSVAERYREIGTLKCLGATDTFIAKVFLVESLVVGFSFSLVGALLGAGVAALFGWRSGAALLPFVQASGLIPLLVGSGLTLVSSIAPALAAARMQANEALRVEV